MKIRLSEAGKKFAKRNVERAAAHLGYADRATDATGAPGSRRNGKTVFIRCANHLRNVICRAHANDRKWSLWRDFALVVRVCVEDVAIGDHASTRKYAIDFCKRYVGL